MRTGHSIAGAGLTRGQAWPGTPALGLATLVTVASSHVGTPQALATAYSRAFVVIEALMVVVAALARILPSQRDERRSPEPTR
ncbi:hypothetical protein [Allokutzneria sp. NRRL B-24872]|uniref:hypothetical protein n=1 Tax=Allokutzneria sp. NRRL B-24872 TaxID=1137961 RepID=UPI000A382FEE|nr:hypothetical protein [Allokutzneria sp. NRRL B-24872]